MTYQIGNPSALHAQHHLVTVIPKEAISLSALSKQS